MPKRLADGVSPEPHLLGNLPNGKAVAMGLADLGEIVRGTHPVPPRRHHRRSQAVVLPVVQNWAPRVDLKIGSNEAVKEAVARGVGVAVLSINTVRKEVESGQLIALEGSRDDDSVG